MSDHIESQDKRPQVSEKALKRVYFPYHGFSLFPSVKTYPIVAPQGVFLGQVVSGYPPQIRRIGGDPDDSHNDSLPRRRSQKHRCTPRKSCSRTVSSYSEAGWLLDRDYNLLLSRRNLSVLESRGLSRGLRAIAQRSPQASTSVRRYQVRPLVRIIVLEDEWSVTLVSAQRQGGREGKNTTILGCDPNTSTASPTRLIHQDTPCAGEYMPCGNDGIDAHVEKRWRTPAFLHRPYEAQIGSPPFPHNRFENSFMRNPCHPPGKFTRRSFQQSLGKPCTVYVNSNRPDRTVGKLKLTFCHDGFPTLPQGLLLLFLIFRRRRRMFMRKIADRVNIITTVIVMDRQLTIDSKLPL